MVYMLTQIIDLFRPDLPAVKCTDPRCLMYSQAIGSITSSCQLVAWSAPQGVEMLTLGLQAASVLLSNPCNMYSPSHIMVSLTIYFPSVTNDNNSASHEINVDDDSNTEINDHINCDEAINSETTVKNAYDVN